MNSSFDELAAVISGMDQAIARWTVDQAAAAYKKPFPKEPMKPDDDFDNKTNADIICSGVRACHLALEVLQHVRTEEEGGNAYSRSMRHTAKRVLADWGVAEVPVQEPAAPPGGAPETKEPDALIWPPPAPTPYKAFLPEVYKENFYIHQEQARLVLVGSYWNAESWTWRMKFRDPSLVNQASDSIWLDHTQVKPGDEIQKVIDASTLAGNTDP